MHLYFVLNHREGLTLPIHYNHLLQATLYNSMEPQLANFLHNQGYSSNKRVFKLFAFSKLTGNFKLDQQTNTIKYGEVTKLTVSSPLDDVCQSLANELLLNPNLRLGQQRVIVDRIELKKYQISTKTIRVKTLSPIVVYSTLLRPDGRKYTCYFQAGEPMYNELITNNLRKKYNALFGAEPPDGEVSIKSIGPTKMRINKYKNFIIKGYEGKFVLTGPEELLQLSVDCGLGSKNSQGFGCIEII
ncbi:MAG: CRISPR-associated endoribonuclease Cas6 [Clostridia bacterium]|nr:CRISPR-associated endoribonuclease Cas6 [Clostridia bacterium]